MTGVIDLPLAGVRVVDLTDRLGRYPGRLFGDLGADVIRVRARGTMPTGPDLDADFVFSTLGQRLVELDPDETTALETLLAEADL